MNLTRSEPTRLFSDSGEAATSLSPSSGTAEGWAATKGESDAMAYAQLRAPTPTQNA